MRRYGRLALLLLVLMSGLLVACDLLDDYLPPTPLPETDAPDPPGTDDPQTPTARHWLEVDPMLVVVEVGERVQLVATVRDVDGEAVDSVAVAWSSADDAVVSIDASGLMTAVGVGGPIEVMATIPDGSVASQVVVVPQMAERCPALGLEVERDYSLAVLGAWEQVSAVHHRFSVPETAPGSSDYTWGPGSWGNRYAPARNLFPVTCGDQPAVIWQAQDSGQVFFTKTLSDVLGSVSQPIVVTEDLLIAATFGMSTVYLLTMERVEIGEDRPVRLRLHAHGLGAFEGIDRQVDLDTSRTGFNVVAETTSRFSTGHASLAFSDGRLALMLARGMLVGDDGLSHQGGLAAIFDARTLALTRYLGQTSGHSFQNHLTVDTDGAFVAIDMGDNFPRGVHLHRFDAFSWRRQVAFTFKTLHGRVPQNPAGVTFPVYDEISSPERTFYRWSNDNNTYSELGAVVEMEDGYVVLFVGEPDEQGRALRNETAADYIYHPRAIGLIKIRRDFPGSPGFPLNIVPDDIVLTDGITEEGEFYTFGGHLASQRNTGVRWLTHGLDVDQENVSRLKAAGIGSDRILLVWERWTRSTYIDTWFMVVDSVGNVVTEATPMGSLQAELRLHRANDPIVHDGRMLLYFGSPEEPVVHVLAIEVAGVTR